MTSRAMFLLLPALLACGPGAPASSPTTAPTATIAPASSAAPTTAPLASAAPAGSVAAGVCKPVGSDDLKAFLATIARALESGDTATWDRLQSARMRERFAAAKAEERKLRADAWKEGLRLHQGELASTTCRMEPDDRLVCDTARTLRLHVTRENCELRIDEN